MTIHFGDTPEGEKISKEMEEDLAKRLAYEDYKMWGGIFLGVGAIFATIPVSLLLAFIIRGGNL
ncbi:hypothetical protein KUA24_113 [Vibrio phage HNL01]|nr:hypothetical protein KUA24_113 [Vibrio phage HNL01]